MNCRPLAGDLQLTGVKVLFIDLCVTPPMIVGTWSMTVVLGWSIIDKITGQNYNELTFSDPFNHACTLCVYIDSCTRHRKPGVGSRYKSCCLTCICAYIVPRH